jgi:hypothetical protein
VTSLPDYDVVYATGDGLHLAVYTSQKRPGAIQIVVQSSRVNRVLLSPDQLARLQNLVQQGKSKLDSLRAGK